MDFKLNILVTVLKSGHWADPPCSKPWPGHCVVLFTFHSVSLHPGVKNEYTFNSNYDGVIGKPDKLWETFYQVETRINSGNWIYFIL